MFVDMCLVCVEMLLFKNAYQKPYNVYYIKCHIYIYIYIYVYMYIYIYIYIYIMAQNKVGLRRKNG